MSLGRDFYVRETRMVARELLGKVLINGERELMITEMEAYLGPEDLASHARFGPTTRTKIMWGQGGLLYVYLVYGMYEMTNIITGNFDEPGAVLLRGGMVPGTGERITGPGKLSKYLGIARGKTGLDLVNSPTLYVDDRGIVPEKIVTTPRIGVDYAGKWAKKKWRYVANIFS